MKKISRAEKNCNPGNIRRSTTKYRGEADSQDRQFKAFLSMEWGYRAIFVLLYTYSQRYGLKTIPTMIGRYAPPDENNTDSYSRFVCRESGVEASTVIDTLCREQMIPIVATMAKMEGVNLPDSAQIEQGWELFVKHKP